MNDTIKVSELKARIVDSTISPADLRIIMDIIDDIQKKES